MKRLTPRIANLAAFVCVVLLPVVSIGCSESAVSPDLREPQASRPRLVLQPGGLYCTEPDAKLSSGAPYRVCADPDGWNRDLVVFIPGYHDPARTPRLPDDLSETPASVLFTKLGFGFATTDFRAGGLLQPEWLAGDLLELVATAKTLLTNTTGRTTRYVYQTGGSQGGLGTVQAVEQYPNTFSGGLAGCGPIGDYRKQIAYVADFRLLFDYFFADVITGWPVWKQDLSANAPDPGYINPDSWQTAEQASAAALPGNPDRIQQVLALAHAPTDPQDPGSINATTLGILWYSFRGTNDAIQKLGGMPFGNLDRHYSGSSDDQTLNAGVQRFQLTASAEKLATLQTSARLRRPLVTIHTTGDPIVPVWHESLYRSRLNLLGRLLHTGFTIHRYGHCNFTDAEVLAAFAVLVLKVSGQNLLVSRALLPRPQAQEDFLLLSRLHGASPVVTP